MLWVHFHRLFRHHVRSHAAVAQSLGFHDALHVCRPAILGGCEHTRRISHARTDQDLLYFVPKYLFHELCQGLELSFQLLELLLLILVIDFKTLLGGRLQLLSVKLLQLLHCILVNWIHHVQNLDSLLPECLEEWRRGDRSNALAGNVIDVVLTFLHPIDILLEADLLVARFRTVISHERWTRFAMNPSQTQTRLRHSR